MYVKQISTLFIGYISSLLNRIPFSALSFLKTRVNSASDHLAHVQCTPQVAFLSVGLRALPARSPERFRLGGPARWMGRCAFSWSFFFFKGEGKVFMCRIVLCEFFIPPPFFCGVLLFCGFVGTFNVLYVMSIPSPQCIVSCDLGRVFCHMDPFCVYAYT